MPTKGRRVRNLAATVLVAASSVAAYAVVDGALGASAAPGKGKEAASIWIEAGDAATADAGGLRVTDEVRFGFTTSYWDETGGTGPWLRLQCFRSGEGWEGQLDGVLILSDSRAGFPGGYGYGEPFVLAGTSWHEGPADCVGVLGHRSKNGRFVEEATVGFHVTG